MEPEEDSMTTATNTTLQSSRSVPTQKEGSYTNRSVNYSREVIGGRKINAMSEYEVDLNELWVQSDSEYECNSTFRS